VQLQNIIANFATIGFDMKNEIILYRPDELAEHIEVRFDEETVWLNQAQMVILFGREQSVISRHIRNIFKEGELDEKVVYAKFAYTTQHGATKNLNEQLNLDIQKVNEQYYGFEAKHFTQSHDRFLIIDGKEVYHLGASLKDLGKKWFAFSKMDKNSVESIINAIEEVV